MRKITQFLIFLGLLCGANSSADIIQDLNRTLYIPGWVIFPKSNLVAQGDSVKPFARFQGDSGIFAKNFRLGYGQALKKIFKN